MLNSDHLLYIRKLLQRETYEYENEGARCKVCNSVTKVGKIYAHFEKCLVGDVEDALETLIYESFKR